MTLLEFKKDLYQYLESHYPATEISSFFKIILEEILHIPRIDFALEPNKQLTPHQISLVKVTLQKLSNFIPIQQILGYTTFYDLPFKVTPDVLIPRPETELLVSWILNDYQNQSDLEILDIGTGSGCIPISLYKNLQNAHISTIDVSLKAIEIAKENAKANQVTIEFICKDILNTVDLEKKYDVIVSNPPYVRELEKKEMHQNVMLHEPHLALFVSDNDPLCFYKKIGKLAFDSLTTNGGLYLEINEYLGPETAQELENIGFSRIILEKDQYGKNRMIKALK